MVDAPENGTISEPIRQLVATASDEQLAWMVGPDRRFYSQEALEAAAVELERRSEAGAGRGPGYSFNVAAFVLGPLWYFYHGLIGRGLMILVLWLGAFFGLAPVARAFGIPAPLWVLAIVIGVGAYCSRYAERDLAESAAQARAAARRAPPLPDQAPEAQAGPVFVKLAEVSGRMAGEQARALLEAQGIQAIVKCEDTGVLGPGSGAGTRSVFPARVLVPRHDLEKARELISALFSPDQAVQDRERG